MLAPALVASALVMVILTDDPPPRRRLTPGLTSGPRPSSGRRRGGSSSWQRSGAESHGLTVERRGNLDRASLGPSTRKNATARGLQGLVDFRGRWESPDAVGEKVRADEALSARLAEYNARRGATRHATCAKHPNRHRPARVDAARAPRSPGLLVQAERPRGRGARPLHIGGRVPTPTTDSNWRLLGYVQARRPLDEPRPGRPRPTARRLTQKKADPPLGATVEEVAGMAPR